MKKNFFTVLAVLFLFVSCKSQAPVIEANYQAQSLDIQLNNLTNQMVKSLAQERKSKIAIMEFPDLHGQISEFGKFIPEELTTRLFMTRRFEVLERQLLNKVLEEQNLGMSGLIDASSAAEIGKVLGVDAIVTGTITDMGTAIRINARMIATETAGVFAVASVSIDKEPHIIAMMNRMSPTVVSQPASPQAPVVDPEPPTPPPAQPQRPARPDPVQFAKTTVGDFEFEVISSQLTNDNRAVIEIQVTNTSTRDHELQFLSDTKLFDNFGHEYEVPVRSIGSKRAPGRYSTLTHLFISQLPTRIRIEYSEIDPDVSSVALLNLSIRGIDGNVQLRNFSLNR